METVTITIDRALYLKAIKLNIDLPALLTTAIEAELQRIGQELTDLDRFIALMHKVFEGNEDGMRSWINSPNRALGKRAPYTLIETEFGLQKVTDLLKRLEKGGIS